MANLIKLRKGLDINLKGKAAAEVVAVKEPGFYALVPDDFTGVTPKVVVKEQEYVMAGGSLFIDKNHPEVKFVSPVSGVVTSVERGARRKVMSITVEAAAEQDYEEFGKKDVAKMDAAAVKELLLASGMFAFIKQRPYDVIADPTIAPKAIFVSSFDSNPLAPEFEFALKGEEANFQAGLDALAKIANEHPDIIFVVIMMPRLDGYQTCSLIKRNARYKTTPVIMLSSKDGLFDRARGRMVGSDQYLTKPFTQETLVDAVQTYASLGKNKQEEADRYGN